ncbi:MAG: hypothetical protein HZC36_09685 [Armatimonadetes bacterium]|nr:hypothetical protein [Armatimonadota bacterium]
MLQVLALVIPLILLADEADIQLKNRRATEVFSMILRLVPDGVRMSVNDLTGVIHVQGSTEEVEQVRKLARSMDIKAMEVFLKFALEVKSIHVAYDGTVTIRNNVAFRFSDSASNVNVAYQPQVLPERIKSIVTVEIDGALFRDDKVGKVGERLEFKAVDMKPVNEKARQRLDSREIRWWPLINVTPSLKESKRL